MVVMSKPWRMMVDTFRCLVDEGIGSILHPRASDEFSDAIWGWNVFVSIRFALLFFFFFGIRSASK